MNRHVFCHLTHFCMECGAAMVEVEDGIRPEECYGGDSKTYLKARFHQQALTDRVMQQMGLRPDKRDIN